MSEYPKWRYHATEKAMIARDPEHEDAEANSGAGWVDHPSQLEVAEAPAQLEVVEPPSQLEVVEPPAKTKKAGKTR